MPWDAAAPGRPAPSTEEDDVKDSPAAQQGHPPGDDQAQRAETLRVLHADPRLLVLVNVWDVASARTVADLPGTRALATASAAVADVHGFPDGEQIPLELHLAAVARICAATTLPVTADLERGYGDVAATIAGALAAGAVGANIEDDLCPVPEMRARVRDAVTAGRAHGIPLVLNARTCVWLRRPEWDEGTRLREGIERGLAYLDEGADCVFAPGCTDEESIRRLVGELGPGRLSLLAVPGLPAPERLEELGVARVSHGPFAHRHILAALASYAREHDPQG